MVSQHEIDKLLSLITDVDNYIVQIQVYEGNEQIHVQNFKSNHQPIIPQEGKSLLIAGFHKRMRVREVEPIFAPGLNGGAPIYMCVIITEVIAS